MIPRDRLRVLVSAPWFDKVITAVILVNAITLGAETSPELLASIGDVLHAIDRLALVIFVVELALRFGAYGREFFRDPSASTSGGIAAAPPARTTASSALRTAQRSDP